MKKIIALFAVVVLMGQGCGTETANQPPSQPNTEPQQDTEQIEPDIDEQPVEEMEESPVEGIKGVSETQPGRDNDTDDTEEENTQTVSMTSGNFFFEPTTINAEAGQEVQVTFSKNTGFHTFVIDEIDINSQIEEGETVTFTAPTEPGSYAFYCDVGDHRAQGMEGTLIVE